MASEFNGSMLQLARELRGWTQTRLANESGVTQSYISELEHGYKQDASDEKVGRLANTLSFPRDFFYQDERYEGFGLSLVFHRKKASSRVAHDRRLQAEENLRRIHITRLLSGVDLIPAREFLFMDIDDHDGDADRVAAFVRVNWKLPLGPIPNLIRVIEDAGGIVFRFSFGTRDIDAMSQWPTGCPPLFFVNADAPADRTRFSLAHELGHVIMHDSASETMESEANRFASEFLMPRREIMPHLAGITIKKAYSMKPYWRVSMQALIRRAKTLAAIDHTTYSRISRRISSLGMRTREQVPITAEHPRLVDRILNEFQQNVKCSDDELAAMLSLAPDEFRSMYRSSTRALRIANP